jgi:hypothetical protein
MVNARLIEQAAALADIIVRHDHPTEVCQRHRAFREAAISSVNTKAAPLGGTKDPRAPALRALDPAIALR